MARRPTISRFRREAAHRLRANETSAETRLWQGLRRLPMKDTHFRRQVPIGPFIVDFACPELKLIVEVDGPSHTSDGAEQRDARRTVFLEGEGYRNLRFWNGEVYRDLEAVLATVLAELATPPRRRAVVDPPSPGEGKAAATPIHFPSKRNHHQ